MACLSNEYLTGNESCFDNNKNSSSAMFKALMYSTSESDLTALLFATETGVDKLPVLSLSEAKA